MRWLRWPAATVIAYALGAVAGVALTNAVARPIGGVLSGVLFIALFGAVFGVVVGLVQFVVLPRRDDPMRWTVLTALGFAIGYVLAAFVGEAVASVISPTISIIIGGGAIQDLSGATLGACIGLAQARALRLGRGWIIATAVGALFGQALAAAILELLEVDILKANLIPSFGGVLGLFIGVAQAVYWGRREQGRTP